MPPADISSLPLLPAGPAGVARAAELIEHGELVVVPTETVYGIAVNLGSPDARASARAIKSRTSPGAALGPWVIHVAQADDLLGWAPHLSPLGRRLIGKSLPGPVAFQIRLTKQDDSAARERLGAAADETIQEGWITMRCPDFSATQDVLAKIKSPVAIIGAGTPAQPGVFEPQDLPASVLAGDQAGVHGILDGGTTRYRRSSTVVRIDGENFAVVRQGVIDERIIDRLADFTILFLCSGNTCRSPMSAAIAAKALAGKLGIETRDLPLRHIVVQSAGLHASRGMRATLEAVDAVKELGGDLSSHLSQAATPDLLRRADIVYTMTDAHREEVLELYPWAERKTFRLDPEGDVADPIGSPMPVYQRVAKRLASVIEKRLGELAI